MKISVFCLLILLVLAVPVFAQDDDEELLIDEAFVDSLTIDNSELILEGELPDACTEIGEITQSFDGDTIQVVVFTVRSADAFCAAVLAPFEVTYELDTSEIPQGTYTLDVNGITEKVIVLESGDIEILELECPEADDETVLFEDLGMCFVYPAEFEEISGKDFVLISQPMTESAVLLIEIDDAEETSLDDLREQLEDEDFDIEEFVLGGKDALVIESGDINEAYILVDEQLYRFFLQMIEDDEDDTGELLWTTVIDSLFFPEAEEE